jgi:hypothetical protein
MRPESHADVRSRSAVEVAAEDHRDRGVVCEDGDSLQGKQWPWESASTGSEV